MHTSELLKHIYDINLSYLLLAQRLIVQDKASAMFRLGINEEMATTLAALTAWDEFQFESMMRESFQRCIRRAEELGQ